MRKEQIEELKMLDVMKKKENEVALAKILLPLVIIGMIGILFYLRITGYNIYIPDDFIPSVQGWHMSLSGVPDIDRMGNPVIIPESIEKIVSIGQENTDILRALGLNNQMIALCYVYDIDIEFLLTVKPSIIFSPPNAPWLYDAKSEGFQVMQIPRQKTISDIYQDIIILSHITDTWDLGLMLFTEMHSVVNFVQTYTEEWARTNRYTVFFKTAFSPYIQSIGQGTLIHDILSTLNTDNIFLQYTGNIAVTDSQIIYANPDVIFTNVSPACVAEIKVRPGWENIIAVQNNRVYYINTGIPHLSAINVMDVLASMMEIIYF